MRGWTTVLWVLAAVSLAPAVAARDSVYVAPDVLPLGDAFPRLSIKGYRVAFEDCHLPKEFAQHTSRQKSTNTAADHDRVISEPAA